MGLFKNILDVAVKAATDAISQQVQQPKAPAYTPSSKPEETRPAPPADWNAYFSEILSAEFPQYSVRKNVPVTEIAGDVTDNFKLYETRPLQAYKAEWGAPYTFVLSQGEKPVGIVMLGSGHSHDSNVKYLIARKYAQKLGLPYINFYTQMPNEREYVIGRIKKFMNA